MSISIMSISAQSGYGRCAQTTCWIAAALVLTLTLGSTVACRAQDDTDKKVYFSLQAASKAYRAGKYDEAERACLEAATAAPKDSSVQQSAAELLFLSGKVNQSLPLFEAANKLNPVLVPQNWQRGVALGCAGKFEEGAEQFGKHHEVNPNDVENSAWYFLCIAKSKGRAAAEAKIIPSGGDRREPMMSVLKMLQGTLKPDEVLVAAKANTAEGPERKTAMFYGFLYVGLYYDSIGESEKAVAALDQAITFGSMDYMGRTAQIYRELRFPNPSSAAKPAEPKSGK